MTVKSCFLSLTCFVDKLRDVCYNYYYNNHGNVSKVEERNIWTNALLNTKTYTYDSCQRVSSVNDTVTGQTYSTLYKIRESDSAIYPEGEAAGVTLNGKYTDRIFHDVLGRPGVRKLTLASSSDAFMTDEYVYQANGSKTTNFVSQLKHNSGSGDKILTYAYDANGNITSVRDSSTEQFTEYGYDKLGRLISETIPALGITRSYSYNDGGNMVSWSEENSLTGETATRSFVYSSMAWRDQLVCYDGDCITYDEIGNPTTYKGNTLTWTNVRRLASYGSNTFRYGADGIRYRKNNTTYTLDGNRILKETNGTS